MDPNQPVPRLRPPDRSVTAEDKELIRLMMKAQSFEPGYPCNHRSTPLYMEDPSVTLSSLYLQYKAECEERQVRLLSFESFRRIVKYLVPTLHLGKTRTDSCNSCFSLDLQIQDPQTSAELKEELVAAKRVHLKDAINMRKVIRNIVKTVKETIAPDDPALVEEPVYVPSCFSDPFDRLNRPFVIDIPEGVLGQGDDNIGDGDFDEGDELAPAHVVGEEEEAANDSYKLRVSVQDYGSGIAMPRYGADRPNHDYYANNITLHNMNYVDCRSGHCNIYYYDERSAGKDGNSVTSLRWNETAEFILKEKDKPPTAECKILDNCVGQNKSNTTHKFSMLSSILIYPDGVTDVYFRVGHSHNTSDMKTAHANKAMAKKNLYTPNMVITEINKMKGLTGQLIDERSGVFLDWKLFLDKHFPNMLPGFTSYFLFEFKDGIVHYKDVGLDGEIVTVKSQSFCPDPSATKKILLRELLNLSSTSSVVEIVKAKPRLPPLPVRRVSKKKIDNMKVLYQQIPRSFRWFYPEGNQVHDDPHTELRRRAAEQILPLNNVTEEAENDEREEVGTEPAAGTSSTNSSQGRKRVGRPSKALPILRNQPAIYRFFGRSDEPAESSDEEDIDIAEGIDEEVVINTAQKGANNDSESNEDSSSESSDSFYVDLDMEAQLQFEEENRRFEEGDSPVRKKHREEISVDILEESDNELPEIGKYNVVAESSLSKNRETGVQGDSVVRVQAKSNEMKGNRMVKMQAKSNEMKGNRVVKMQAKSNEMKGNRVVKMQAKSKVKKGINWLEQDEVIDVGEEAGAEYSTVDVNHNNGKVIMKLKKQ